MAVVKSMRQKTNVANNTVTNLYLHEEQVLNLILHQKQH